MKSSKKVTPPKTKSLRDLIDSIEWTGIQTRGCSSKLADDAVSIHFTVKVAKSKNNDNCDFVRIKLGKAIMEKLEWAAGDRIYISNNPDDHFTFLLCKVDSTSGFRLGVEGGSPAGRLQFAWRDNYVPVKVSEPQTVEYEIHKKHLIFRANPTG